MGAATAIARTNVRRGLRNRSLLLLSIVGPLLLGTVLALAFGGSGPELTIGLVDRDDSETSQAIVDGLRDAFEGSRIDLRVGDEVGRVDQEDGVDDAVDSGEVGAVVVVPEGYAASLVSIDGAPLPLDVVGSADDSISTSVAEGIAREIATSADLQRATAIALVTAGRDPTPVLSAGPLTPALAVSIGDYGEPFDAPMYFGPLSVFLFLGLGGAARLLLRDQREGTLDRVRAAPVEPRSIVAGSSGAVVVQGLLAATVVVLGSSLVFGASWGQPIEVVVVLVCFVLSLAGLVGLVVGVTSTEVQAESWTNVIAFSFAVLGGSFFGGAMLPGFLGVVGLLTPNGAAMRALIELGPGDQSLADVWWLLAWLLVVGVVGLVVGGRLLDRRLR